MEQIATKFVEWNVPALATLKSSKAYMLREKLNNGQTMSREEKNWLTEAVNHNAYFRQGVPHRGWHFDFSDVLKRYWVKQPHVAIQEYYAADKTALRHILYGVIDQIVEIA